MDVVFVTDDRFVKPTVVSMMSVYYNNRSEQLTFHVVVDDTVKDSDRYLLNSVISANDNETKLFIYDINIKEDFTAKLPNLGKRVRHTKAAYYRLFLCDTLPMNIGKVLYLDGDVIVRDNLASLWAIDIDNFAVACAPDGSEKDESIYKRLGVNKEEGYFNSGVCLINLDYWRANNVQTRFECFILNNSEKIRYWDQDVLNCVFRKEKLCLPLKYNVQTGYLLKKEFINMDYEKYEEELNEAISNPYIIHYIGPKPWSPECYNPYKYLFYKYKEMTVLKDKQFLEKNKFMKALCRHIIREFLTKTGLLKYKYVDLPVLD